MNSVLPAPQNKLWMYNVSHQRYYHVDEMAALVWQAIQQPRTLNEICAIIMEHFPISREECERELLALLNEMETAGLIQQEAVA